MSVVLIVVARFCTNLAQSVLRLKQYEFVKGSSGNYSASADDGAEHAVSEFSEAAVSGSIV